MSRSATQAMNQVVNQIVFANRPDLENAYARIQDAIYALQRSGGRDGVLIQRLEDTSRYLRKVLDKTGEHVSECG